MRHLPSLIPTPREIACLLGVVEGLSNKQIAKALGIARPTVANHLQALYGKLGVTSRASAIVAALKKGLIHL